MRFLSHYSLLNAEADWLMVLIFRQSKLQCPVADMAEAASSRLVEDIRCGVMHHFFPLRGHFLLHSLRAHLDVQVLLEASTHWLEWTDFLRVHLCVYSWIAAAD